MLKRVQHDNRTVRAGGFTLIELLVVVLIIGILASVALPQYNKAVRKARLSEVATTVSSVSKAIDMWLLENGGFPSDSIIFSGNGTGSGYAKLDITSSCATENSDYCYTKVGGWSYACDPERCGIDLSTRYNADESTGNKWLGEGNLYWQKYPNQEWKMVEPDEVPVSFLPEICRWWKGMYGSGHMNDSEGNPSTYCDEY